MLANYVAGRCPAPADPVITTALHAAAQRTGAPLELLQALAFEASGYNATALRDGRCGLMGLPHDRMFDPFNPAVAADCAGAFLVAARAKFRGSWAHALAALHWDPPRGPWLVAAHVDVGSWPPHVRQWVARVLGSAGYELPIAAPRVLMLG